MCCGGQGDIAASYSVKPLADAFPPGTEVNFSPSSGCICINKAERVQASFRPAFVGEFEATALWAIEASPEDIVLKLKVYITELEPLTEAEIPKYCSVYGVDH